MQQNQREGLKAGMDPAVVEAIAARRPPALRDDTERVVYEASSTLLGSSRVPEALYQRGVAVLGERRGVMARAVVLACWPG